MIFFFVLSSVLAVLITTKLVAPTHPVFSNRSTSIGSGFVKALHYIDRTFGAPDTALLGVQYIKRGRLFDIQASVTGGIEVCDLDPHLLKHPTAAISAAIREVFEEMGVKLTPEQLLYVYTGWSDSAHTHLVTTFAVNLSADAPPAVDPGIIYRCVGANPPSLRDTPTLVQVVLFGRPDDLCSIAAANAKRIPSSDSIGALIALPLTEIVNNGHLDWTIHNGLRSSREVRKLEDLPKASSPPKPSFGSWRR